MVGAGLSLPVEKRVSDRLRTHEVRIDRGDQVRRQRLSCRWLAERIVERRLDVPDEGAKRLGCREQRRREGSNGGAGGRDVGQHLAIFGAGGEQTGIDRAPRRARRAASVSVPYGTVRCPLSIEECAWIRCPTFLIDRQSKRVGVAARDTVTGGDNDSRFRRRER